MHDPSVKAVPFPGPTPVRDLRPSVSPLPRPLTSFVGRTREVEAVCDLFRDGMVRLVTLTGPGGVGKTRLAIRIGGELEAEFPHGAGFVPLAAIREVSQVGVGIAREFHVDQVHEQVHEFREDDPLPSPLRAFHGLVVLDNFEHVIEASLVVARLLAESPDMKILVTSRQPLNIAGEHVFPVSPLPLPASSIDMDATRSSPAVQLFLQRAMARNPVLATTPEDVESMAGICRALDGLPLAIELAAAHVATMAPAELLRRMEPRLPLLGRNTVDAPSRHRTMRDSIKWSYGLLDKRLQLAFRRLSVFVGGFTMAAAEVVLEGEDTLDVLESLVARSLIIARPGVDGETRFLMLEVVREFGLEHLVATGEEPRARQLHADWVLQVAERSQWSWFMPFEDGGQRLAELEKEFPNIREALRWHESSGDVEAGLRLAGILGGLWCVLGHGREGLRWLARAEDPDAPVPEAVRAKALATESWTANKFGDPARALGLGWESLRLVDEVEQPLDRSYGLVITGVAARNAGDTDMAEALLLEAITVLDGFEPEPWIQNWITTVIVQLGTMYLYRGELEEAESKFQKVIQRQTRDGESIGSSHIFGAHVHAFLGDIAQIHDDHEMALRHYRQNLALAWRVHDMQMVCGSLGGIGGALASLEDHHAAARFFGASEGCHARFGFVFEEEVNLQRALGLPEPWAREAEPCLLAERLRSTLRARQPYDLPPIRDIAVVEEAWDAGRRLDLATAVDEALSIEEVSAPGAPDHGLTQRELDVLRLLAEGKTDREIAAELYISRRTAATHVRHIYSKLGVSSRAAAAVWAVRNEVT